MNAILEFVNELNHLYLLLVIPLSILAFKISVEIKVGDPHAKKLRYKLKVLKSRAKFQMVCPHAEVTDSNSILSLIEEGYMSASFCAMCNRKFSDHEEHAHARAIAEAIQNPTLKKEINRSHHKALQLQKKFELLGRYEELD